MNTHTQRTATRALLTTLAASAFAFAACGTETGTPEVATPVADSGRYHAQPYIRPAHPAEPRTVNPYAGEDVRAPRAIGGDPTLPTGTPSPGPVG